MAIVSRRMMPTAEIYPFVMARLREKRIPQREVARASGVPFSTVSKIAQGVIHAPNVHHVQALFNFFSARASQQNNAPEAA